MSLADATHTYAALPHGFRTGLTRKEAEWVTSRFAVEVGDASVVAERAEIEPEQ